MDEERAELVSLD